MVTNRIYQVEGADLYFAPLDTISVSPVTGTNSVYGCIYNVGGNEIYVAHRWERNAMGQECCTEDLASLQTGYILSRKGKYVEALETTPSGRRLPLSLEDEEALFAYFNRFIVEGEIAKANGLMPDFEMRIRRAPRLQCVQ